jgi:murein DD-endopeptidase MepM/ murein hydrolase activator NlpD
MVVSNSTPINRRAAQENVAMQEQKRAAGLAATAKTDSMAAVQTMNTLNMTPIAGRDTNWDTQYKVANDANSLSNTNNQYFKGVVNTPISSNFAIPTNDLGQGLNTSSTNVGQNNTPMAGNIVSDPLRTSNASQAAGSAPGSTSTGVQTTPGTSQFSDPIYKAPSTTSSSLSKSAQDLLNFSQQRRTERMANNALNPQRNTAIINEQVAKYQSDIANESKTDAYKKNALMSEGFKGDGTDIFDTQVQDAYRKGGKEAALQLIFSQSGNVGDNLEAQQSYIKSKRDELDRIIKFDAINNGTYVSDEDQKILDDLKNESTQSQKDQAAKSKKQQDDLIAQRNQDSQHFDEQINGVQSSIDAFAAIKSANPEMYNVYAPIVNNLLSQKAQLLQEKFQLDNAAYNPDPYIDELTNYQDQLLVDKEASKKLIARSSDLKLQAAKDVQEAMNAQLEIKKINDTQAEVDKSQQNIKNELTNRRLANRFGIEGDTNGLQWMQESVDKGVTELANMKKMANIENVSLTQQITSQYYQSVQSALIDYDSKNLALDSEYNTNVLNVSGIINKTKKEEADAAQARIATYWENKKKNDNDIASILSAAHESLFTEKIRLQTETDKKINDAFDNLISMASLYGSSNPGALQSQVKALTKLGVDMSGFNVNASTQTELGRIASAANAASTTMAERTSTRMQDYTTMYGPDTGYIMQSLASGKFNNVQVLSQMTRLEQVGNLSDTNPNKLATFLDVARDGMETADREKLTNSAVIKDRLDDTIAIIEKYKGTDIWNTFVQNKYKWGNLPKDSELLQIQSNLGWIVTKTTKDFFGANFTVGEMGRADTFLPNLIKGQNSADLEGILKNWNNQINLEAASSIGDRFGSGGRLEKMLGDKNVFDVLSGGSGDSSPNWDIFNSTGAYNTDNNTDTQNGITTNQYGNQDVNGGIPGFNMSTEAGDTPPSSNLTSYNNGTFKLPPPQEVAYSPFISSPIRVTGYGSSVWDAGVDIAAPKGTPIIAQLNGTVLESVSSFNNDTMRPDPMYAPGKKKDTFGNRLKIKYEDGYIAQYSHLAANFFKKDQKVTKGLNIAQIGNTGTTYGNTGVHLDFTLWDPTGRMLSAKEAAAYLGITSQTA